jgi:hypothetical protein
MQNYWKIKDSKSNKLIVIKDKCIYKGNPKEGILQKFNSESSNFDYLTNLFSIPYSYIKRIENQTGKDDIKIYFGNDSEEELNIKHPAIKQEVFDFLKQELSNFKYSSKMPSVLKYAKAQFFALLFTTSLFVWSLYLAIQIENGTEYEIVGGGRGIGSIVLGIANFGVFKIVGGFIILLGIIGLALANRLKSRSETEFLIR